MSRLWESCIKAIDDYGNAFGHPPDRCYVNRNTYQELHVGTLNLLKINAFVNHDVPDGQVWLTAAPLVVVKTPQE